MRQLKSCGRENGLIQWRKGDRMERATIRDVAKKAGVSITTVSKALNDYTDVNPETRKRIQEIARQMNYVPNVAGRSMGGRVDKVIGLLINDLRPIDPSGSVYGILSGVCHACQDNNIEFILMTTDGKQQTQRPLKVLCLRKQLTGLICAGFRLTTPICSSWRRSTSPALSLISAPTNPMCWISPWTTSGPPGRRCPS